jgi:hypothetical protein
MASQRAPYALEAQGDCMGDLVPTGTVLVVEPGVDISPGDLVAIVLDTSKSGPWARFGERMSEDGHAAFTKIFLSAYEVDGERFGLFGQLNPPAIVPIPFSAALTVDRVSFSGECNGVDLEALKMLEPFAMVKVAQREAAHAI